MNKKLVLGISVAFMAGGFWACGSGDVVESDDNLEGLAVALLDQIGDVEVAKAISSCTEDPQCAAEMGNAPSLAVQSSSSSSKPASSSATPKSSGTMSSSGLNLSFGPVGHKSSSSNTPPPSSATVQSSSSIVVPAGQYGYCTPSAKTAELKEKVTWTFNWDTKTSGVGTSDILAATYSWEFPDGSPATGAAKAFATAYEVSGPKTASVTVSTPSHGAQTIACAEGVNINGAPITGCVCTPDTTVVDIATNPIAKWTVSGCVSQGKNIIGYTWTGATGEADVGAFEMTEDKQEVSPVVTVANDDNTKKDVTCPTVKAWDSANPNFILTLPSQNKILAEGKYTIDMTYVGWNGQSEGKMVYGTLQLQVEGTCSVTINGTPVSITYNKDIKNTDETILMDVPANCVKGVSAY